MITFLSATLTGCICLTLASCGSTALAPLEQLELLAEPDFEFRASVASPSEAWAAVLDQAEGPHGALVLGAQPQAASATFAPQDSPWQESPSEGPFIEVLCTSVTLDADQATAFLGWQANQAWAVVARRQVLEQRLGVIRRELPGAALVQSTLHVLPDQKGTLSVINQTAYVRDFRLQQFGSSVIADPNIGILGEGFSLSVEATQGAGDGVSLVIDLASADVQQPHASSAFRMPSGTAVSIQQPLVLAQSIQTSCTLARDEALILVMLGSENSQELLFTILSAQPYIGS